MYIEKIIENATTENIDRKLNILIINQFEDEYIADLCNNLNHNFYIFPNLNEMPQWINPQIKPYNLNYVVDLNDIDCKFLDLIISFGRNEFYDIAKSISMQLNINLICIDNCSSVSAPARLYTVPQQADKKEMLKKHGLINVHTNNLIMNSWAYMEESINVVIPNLIPKPLNIEKPSLVFIDPKIPDNYIARIGLKKEYITKNINEAKVYLHLFNNINHLLLTCMRSSIPVAIPNFKKEECFDLDFCLKNGIVIGLPSIIPNVFTSIYVVDEIYNLAIKNNVVGNAEKFINNYCSDENNFKTLWENIINYTSKTNYIRGY